MSVSIEVMTVKIEAEKANITKNKALILDWSNRVYKTSTITVTDYHTQGDKYFNLSTNTINENRRKNRIKYFAEEITISEQNIKDLKRNIQFEQDRINIEEKKNEMILNGGTGDFDLDMLFDVLLSAEEV